MIKVVLVHNLKKSKSKNYLNDYSSEFDSTETVEAIASSLRLGGHQVYLVEADEKLPERLRHNQIDIVFNIAEGSFGSSRESQVPALLDFLGIPYTGSGVLALALSLDKAMAKQIFMYNGIPTPRFQLFKKGARQGPLLLRFPLIVKPNCEGSAKGIHASSVVKDNLRLYEEVAKVQKLYQQDVLVEEFIEGKELTVGILGNQAPKILPILEIDFSNCKEKGEFFYSWEVKEDPLYPDPEFYCPARLSKEEKQGVEKAASKAYQALGCLDASRVDIRLSEDSIPYVLEVNALPGLDPKESNLTRMAKVCNIDYPDLINGILESALLRYRIEGKTQNAKCKVKV